MGLEVRRWLNDGDQSCEAFVAYQARKDGSYIDLDLTIALGDGRSTRAAEYPDLGEEADGKIAALDNLIAELTRLRTYLRRINKVEE